MKIPYCLKLSAFLLIFLAIFIPSQLLFTQDPVNNLQNVSEYVPGGVIVKFKNSTPDENEITSKYQLRSTKKVLRGQSTLRVFVSEKGTYSASINSLSKTGYQYIPTATKATILVK